ncbi:hypothetical protein D3C78_1585490 [compost metagenome]
MPLVAGLGQGLHLLLSRLGKLLQQHGLARASFGQQALEHDLTLFVTSLSRTQLAIQLTAQPCHQLGEPLLHLLLTLISRAGNALQLRFKLVTLLLHRFQLVDLLLTQ